MNQVASILYLRCRVQITIPNPDEDNQIKVCVHDSDNIFCGEWVFTAESDNPERWIIEGLESAIAKLKYRGITLDAF